MDGGWMLLWTVVGLAVLVLIIVGTVWLVRNMSGGSHVDARRELDLRCARGQMTRMSTTSAVTGSAPNSAPTRERVGTPELCSCSASG
jgi:putative membrane protein